MLAVREAQFQIATAALLGGLTNVVVLAAGTSGFDVTCPADISTGREWPLLLVGGNALGLKTDGRTVVFPRDGRARNRQVSNLFNSLGHALGDTAMDHFGLELSTRIAPGPLSELYG